MCDASTKCAGTGWRACPAMLGIGAGQLLRCALCLSSNFDQYKKTDENLGSKKEIFSKKLNTKEKKNLAANKYVSAWQRKIETIGNLNYPDFVDSSVPLKLTLSVTLGKDGDLLDYALIKASGNQKLDQAAMEIIEMASPFNEFPEEMADFAEITIIRDWKFGNQEIIK